MGFYFVIYTFIGIVAAAANILIIEGRKDVGAVPLWVHKTGPQFVLLGMALSIIALITSLVNHGIVWAAVSLAEIALGAMIAWMLPMGLRAFLVVTSPISAIAILGILWKFWYI
ncbi:hypothetical protein IS481_00450 [Caldimonas thermodepolymerans]|uniref:hypothetical protein n=1 Tax=Caldimonas thermodepolymerans TaxID=215580 RepID=UPI0011AFE76B|nr:hypothetical protein [Caldimonas thermodepolymerans]QPC31692.1 hypothetical protein IS481_00450 [Caldimonas thermodepolymerans]